MGKSPHRLDWNPIIERMSAEERLAFNRWRERLYDLASDLNLAVGMSQEWGKDARGRPPMRAGTGGLAEDLVRILADVPIIGESLLEGAPDPPSAAGAIADPAGSGERRFRPGDVVRVRPGPPMNVERIGEEGEVGCCWFDDEGGLHRDAFVARHLEPTQARAWPGESAGTRPASSNES